MLKGKVVGTSESSTLTIPYAPIYSEDTGNDDKEFTE